MFLEFDTNEFDSKLSNYTQLLTMIMQIYE